MDSLLTLNTSGSPSRGRGRCIGFGKTSANISAIGHVAHGKTSLLDAIRKTSVAAGEAGMITQAYRCLFGRVQRRNDHISG